MKITIEIDVPTLVWLVLNILAYYSWRPPTGAPLSNVFPNEAIAKPHA